GTSLAPDVLRAAGAPVPVLAQAAGLSQAAQGRRAADLPDHDLSGQAVPVVGGRSAAAGCHPGPLRRLAPDGQALRPGWVGDLRLLRRALALVLGPEAVSAGYSRRPACGLVPGRPEDRRTGGGRRVVSSCPPDRRVARGDDRAGGQGPGRAADGTLRRRSDR